MPYYKYDPQSVLQNATYKLYYDRFIITDRTVHNNKPDIIILHTSTKAASSIDVAIPQSQLHSSITEKLHKYADLKEELIRMWQLYADYTIALVLFTRLLLC